MGNLDQAAEAFNKAVEYNEKSDYKISTSIAHFGLGTVLKKQGKTEQANEELRKAAEEFRREITKKPANHESWRYLGETLAMMGDFKASTEPLQKALVLNPAEPLYYSNLIQVLEYQERYGEAIEVLKSYIKLMKNHKDDQTVLRLQGHLKSLEQKNSTNNQPD
jgi:tetratricopeptide (TPR) repeat protein